MRLLVTGGGGFIGSHLVERLLQGGHEVIVLDRDPATEVSGAEIVRADLADADAKASATAGAIAGAIAGAVRGVDAVFHLAARVGLGRDFSDAPAYTRDNDLATATLLAALAGQGFHGRLVHSSSMVVYGEGAYRCRTHGPVRPAPRTPARLEAGLFDPLCPECRAPVDWNVVTESGALNPRSVYAATKVGQEHLCQVWARETGASVVALRYHNVYGRRLPLGTPYAGVAALFRDQLRQGKSPLVFEDGGQMRDFVHVTDVARANSMALDHDLAPGGFDAFNVASGRPVSILQVARTLAGCFGTEAAEPVVTGSFRPGDVRHVVASAAKASRHLGFDAGVRLEDGLADLAGEPLGAGRSIPA